MFKKLILCFMFGLVVITLGIIVVTNAASPREAQSMSAQALRSLGYQAPQYLENNANAIMQGSQEIQETAGDGVLYFQYTGTNKAAAITKYLSQNTYYYPAEKVMMGVSCEPRDGKIYCILVFENIIKTCSAGVDEMRYKQVKECKEWMRDKIKKASKYN